MLLILALGRQRQVDFWIRDQPQSIDQVPGQPGLCRETLSQEKKNKNKIECYSVGCRIELCSFFILKLRSLLQFILIFLIVSLAFNGWAISPALIQIILISSVT